MLESGGVWSWRPLIGGDLKWDLNDTEGTVRRSGGQIMPSSISSMCKGPARRMQKDTSVAGGEQEREKRYEARGIDHVCTGGYISMLRLPYEHYRLGGMNHRNLFLMVLEPRSPRSTYWQGWFPLRLLSLACQCPLCRCRFTGRSLCAYASTCIAPHVS